MPTKTKPQTVGAAVNAALDKVAKKDPHRRAGSAATAKEKAAEAKPKKPAAPPVPVIPGPGEPPGEWLSGAQLPDFDKLKVGTVVEIDPPREQRSYGRGDRPPLQFAVVLERNYGPSWGQLEAAPVDGAMPHLVGDCHIGGYGEKVKKCRLHPSLPTGTKFTREIQPYNFDYLTEDRGHDEHGRYLKTRRAKLCTKCGLGIHEHILYRSIGTLGVREAAQDKLVCLACLGLPMVIHGPCEVCGRRGGQAADFVPFHPAGLLPGCSRADERALAKPRPLPKKPAPGVWQPTPEVKLLPPTTARHDGPVACQDCYRSLYEARFPPRPVKVKAEPPKPPAPPKEPKPYKPRPAPPGQMGLNLDAVALAERLGRSQVQGSSVKVQGPERSKAAQTDQPVTVAATSTSPDGSAPEPRPEAEVSTPRRRGRPPGSKNKSKVEVAAK